MSELLTRITLPSAAQSVGLMDWGELTTEEMIRQIRQRAEHLREEADAIMAAKNEDFRVDIVRGPHAQHHVRTLQGTDSAGH